MKRSLLILLLLATPCLAARPLKQSTAVTVIVGPAVDFEDGVTPETGMTVTNITADLFKDDATEVSITLSASGGSNDMVHVAGGQYSLELTATDTNTLGYLRVNLTDPDVMAPIWEDFEVLPANVYDSMYSTDKLQVHVTEYTAGVIDATAIGTGAIDADAIATDAIGAAEIASAAIAADEIATDAIGAAEIAADAIGSSELASTAVNEITGGVWGADATSYQSVGTFGKAIGDPGTDSDTIWALANSYLDAAISSRGTSTLTASDNIGINWADITNTGTAQNLSSTTVNQVSTLANDSITAAVIASSAIGELELADNCITANEIATDAITLGSEATGWGTQQTGDVYAQLPSNFSLMLVSGTGVVTSNVNAISDDQTAAVNMEAFFDNTGYNFSNSTIGTVTTVTNGVGLTATAVDDIWDEDIVTAHGTANTSGLIVSQLTHRALGTGWTTDVTANSVLDYLADDGTAAYDRTTDSLQAQVDAGGAADWTSGEKENIRYALGVTGTKSATSGGVTDAILADTGTDGVLLATGSVTATVIATDAIDADAIAADAWQEAADYTWDEDIVAAHGTADTAGYLLSMLTARTVTPSTDVDLASLFGWVMERGTSWDYDRDTDSLQGIAESGASGLTKAQVREALFEDAYSLSANASDGSAMGQVLDADTDAAWDFVQADDSLQAISEGGASGDWSTAEKNQIRFRLALDGTQADPTTGTGTIEDILTDTSTTLDDLVDDLETRLTATRAGYLDELGPTNIPADVDNVLADTAVIGSPAGASIAADIADIPTVSEFEARTLVAASYFDPAADTVANVTLTATATSVTNAVDITATAVDLIWDEPKAGHATADTYGDYLDTEVSGVGGGSSDWTATELQQIRQALGVTGTTLATTGSGNLDAIKTKTDSMTFTKATELDVNLQSINGVEIVGDGSTTPFGVP